MAGASTLCADGVALQEPFRGLKPKERRYFGVLYAGIPLGSTGRSDPFRRVFGLLVCVRIRLIRGISSNIGMEHRSL